MICFEEVLGKLMRHKKELECLSIQLDVAMQQTEEIINSMDLSAEKIEELLRHKDKMLIEDFHSVDQNILPMINKNHVVKKQKSSKTLKMLRRSSNMLKI